MSTTIASINRKVAYEIYDDEVVIINLDTGHYYTLTDASAQVWQWLAEGQTAPAIVDQLAARYADDPLAIHQRVEQFLAEMEGEDLLKRVTADMALNGASVRPTPPVAGSRPSLPPLAWNKYGDMQALLTIDPIHEVDEMGWPNASQG